MKGNTNLGNQTEKENTFGKMGFNLQEHFLMAIEKD